MAEKYKNMVIKKLGIEQNNIMGSLFNKKQYLNNTCMKYIENTQKNEEER